MDTELFELIRSLPIASREPLSSGAPEVQCEMCLNRSGNLDVQETAFESDGEQVPVMLCQKCHEQVEIGATVDEVMQMLTESADAVTNLGAALIDRVEGGIEASSRMQKSFAKAALALGKEMREENPLVGTAPANKGAKAMREYLEELEVEEPEFMKAVNEFRGGNFTLVGGAQDAVLESIAGQVMGGRPPTTKQIAFFRSRTRWYLSEKSQGRQLRTPESCRRRGSDVVSLLAAASATITKKGGTPSKESEIVEDLVRFHRKREYLTEKQYQMLKGMVERAQGVS